VEHGKTPEPWIALPVSGQNDLLFWTRVHTCQQPEGLRTHPDIASASKSVKFPTVANLGLDAAVPSAWVEIDEHINSHDPKVDEFVRLPIRARPANTYVHL
jgi:hypothetical protein